MDASDWMKGIFFSVLASVIGAGSKLAIRKSWLMEEDREAQATAAILAEAEAADREEKEEEERSRRRRSRSTPPQHGSYECPRLGELERRHRLSPHTTTTTTTSDGIDDDGSSSYHTATTSISANPNEPNNEPLPLDEPEYCNGEAPAVIITKTAEGQQHHQAQEQQEQEQQRGNRRRGRSIYTAVQSDQLSSPESPPCRHRSSVSATAGSAHDNEVIVVVDTESHSSHSNHHHHHHRRRSYYCSLPFFLRFSGMIGMTFLNPAFGLLAMNYASPSILAPFSGLTLVWVIVLSRPLIGESPTCAQKVASSLIVVGEVMVATFGDHSNDQDETIERVEASYREAGFLLYFVALALWMFLLAYWVAASPPYSSLTLRRFAWGASGGSITGLAQCFIKDSLVVIKATPPNQQKPWYIPLFVIMGMASCFGGLLLLTATMKRYDATYSAAMFVGSFVVSTSIMSAFHYHTFEHLAQLMDFIMYPLGLFILMVGVSILVRRGGAQALSEDGAPNDSDRIILATRDQFFPDPHENDGVNNAHPAMMGTSEASISCSKMAHKTSETSLTTSTRTSLTTSTRSAITDDTDMELGSQQV